MTRFGSDDSTKDVKCPSVGDRISSVSWRWWIGWFEVPWPSPEWNGTWQPRRGIGTLRHLLWTLAGDGTPICRIRFSETPDADPRPWWHFSRSIAAGVESYFPFPEYFQARCTQGEHFWREGKSAFVSRIFRCIAGESFGLGGRWNLFVLSGDPIQQTTSDP